MNTLDSEKLFCESMKQILLQIISENKTTRAAVQAETGINITRYLNAKGKNDILCSSLVKILSHLEIAPSDYFKMVENKIRSNTKPSNL